MAGKKKEVSGVREKISRLDQRANQLLENAQDLTPIKSEIRYWAGKIQFLTKEEVAIIDNLSPSLS